jgi:hypothetical protein
MRTAISSTARTHSSLVPVALLIEDMFTRLVDDPSVLKSALPELALDPR